jgi:hypothetical protein
MTEQRRPGRYPDELRQRAVRMVFEAERYNGSQWEAICSVAEAGSDTGDGAQVGASRRDRRGPAAGVDDR